MHSDPVATTTRRLYTRYEHGNHPVDVHEELHDQGMTRRRFDLHLPDGNRIEFASTASLLRHVYSGHHNNVPFTRYFRIEPPRVVVADVADVLAYAMPTSVAVQFGIDLAKRGIEVRRILFARFGAKIAAMGYEPKEVLSEVYRKIVVSNLGTHPFDPRKAGFGHYVYIVCNSALLNFRKKEERRKRKVQTGIAVFEDNRRVILDVGEVADSRHRISTSGRLILDPEQEISGEQAVLSLCERIGSATAAHELACQCVLLYYQGYAKREMARALSVTSKKVGEAIAIVKDEATAWAEDEGIIS